jgi:soluble lytic murein transglycosylase-like protein
VTGTGRAVVLVAMTAAGIGAALTGGLPVGPVASVWARPAAPVADIPGAYLTEYRAAAGTCPGLSWSVLAAVGKVESDHGRSRLPGVRTGANGAGARGPMQFLPATFTAYSSGANPIPPGGARPPSPYNPHDAIHAAANYLCDSGVRDGRDVPGAVFAYNHSTTYVASVLAQASAYRRAGGDLR